MNYLTFMYKVTFIFHHMLWSNKAVLWPGGLMSIETESNTILKVQTETEEAELPLVLSDFLNNRKQSALD